MNEAYESVTFWVYRDSMPIYRTSDDVAAYTRAREVAANFPQARVVVKRVKRVEQEMLVIGPQVNER